MSSLIDAKPELGPRRVSPWPYQYDCIKAISDEFAKGVKSTLAVMPTGCGKGVVLGMIGRKAAKKGWRTLVLAHRDELLQQAVEKLDACGVEAGLEKAGSRARAAYDPDVVVASVQTLTGNKARRLAEWPRDHFDLIITDECHHACSPTYKLIYSYFERARHIGFTATATRLDGQDLGQVYETVAYKDFTIWDAMTAPPPGPYLSRLLMDRGRVDVDLRNLRPRPDEDFTDADLVARIGPMVEVLAREIRARVESRPTIVFTPGVKVAQAMSSALYSLGLSFAWTAGDDPQRAFKTQALKNGDLQGVCNDSIYTEGFDWHACAAVVLCRPTKSVGLLNQMVGRATRLCEGKENALIVDFNFLLDVGQLAMPVELFESPRLASGTLDLARGMAERALKKGEKVDLVDVMRRADAERRRRDAVRVEAREGGSVGRWVRFDPLGAAEVMGMRPSTPEAVERDPATPRQVALLQRLLKVDDVGPLTFRGARRMIETWMERKRTGKATHRQLQALLRNGVDPKEARAMSFAQASEALDRLIGRAS